MQAQGMRLNREFARLVLLAAICRVRQPGCKFYFIVEWQGAAHFRSARLPSGSSAAQPFPVLSH
jgi:predicted P-loop ATPase